MKNPYIDSLVNLLFIAAIGLCALPFVAVVLVPDWLALFDLTAYLGLRGPLLAPSSLLVAGALLLVLCWLQASIVWKLKTMVLGNGRFRSGELEASTLLKQLATTILIASAYLVVVRMGLNALFNAETHGVTMLVLGLTWWDCIALVVGGLLMVLSHYLHVAEGAMLESRQIV